MEISGFTRTSDAVFESSANPVTVDQNQIAKLVLAAKQAENGRARLILHPSRTDSLHEMVIALPPRSFDHPHINDRSGKSFLALSGDFCVVTFHDDGEIENAIILSAKGHFGAKMVRLGKPTWHTIIPLDRDCVFLETILGPFTGNRFLPTCPNPSEEAFRLFADRARKFALEKYREIKGS